MPADYHFPTLYVGLPPRDSLMPGPDVLFREVWEKLSPKEQRRFVLLNELPFTEEEIRTFTAQLHRQTLVHEDISHIYDRLSEGELSSDRRTILELTLHERERRADALSAAMADGDRRILEFLQRREEREPANWDDLPEDPVLAGPPLTEAQKAGSSLVEDVLSFNAAYAAECVANAAGPGPSVGAGAGACTCEDVVVCASCTAMGVV
jgi:hypothetical protein